ncbi:hypothetical protein Enr13x_23850 [Stieleria neptunia]|uniref:Uncharacterized protein n=1 Tax=Stieleria neptunia TaxID=2527979 RepID=A0A518HP36_9BACT|nr:hypothetical protein [Stieleria neptunia]QDV42537.1 hypothetical protein Enr13x_23850 [Stieleria neptunia]
MKNLLTMICGNDPAVRQPAQVIQEICRLSDDEIDGQMKAATEEQRNVIGVYVGVCVRGKDSLSTLQCGALFSMFHAATPELSRAKQIEIMREETGICRTQQYRCVGAFKCFGRILIPDPKLASCFVVEALKILGMECVSQAARDRAIELAQKGNAITKEVAISLKQQFPKALQEPSPPNDSILPPKDVRDAKRSDGDPPKASAKKIDARENPDETALAEIEERKATLAATKSQPKKALPNDSVVYQDNAVRITVSPVGGRKKVSPEDTCYALEQALEQHRLKYPVHSLAATTVPAYSMEDNSHV